MNNQMKIDQDIFENLLILLDTPLKDNEYERMEEKQGGCQPESSVFQKPHNIQIAYQLKRFMDEMPGGFFIYHDNEAEDLIYVNKAMLRIFNCDTLEEFKELTGNSFRGIVHPDDLERIEESIKEQIAHSKYAMDYVEYRIIQKGGAIRWIEDYGHYVRSDMMGGIFYVFIGDATEKLEVVRQEQLRRLEVIEGLSIDYESIFYVDLDANWMKAYRVSSRFAKTFPENKQMREFRGFDAGYLEEWVYPDDRELLKNVSNPDYIRERLSQDKTFHINYRIYKEEIVTYIQLRIVNVGSEDHISQIVMGYRNIDDEMIQEMKQKQMLANALNQANLANSAKTLFLSNMSHDIRTPMNAIVGFTALIKKHLHDHEKVSGYLDMISTSSDQLLQLLNDVLEISNLESEKTCSEEMECSLMDLTHQVQMDILPKAAAKNITLSLDISNLNHDMVFADRGKLVQIITCLVDNAVNYTDIDGWVTITVKEDGESGFSDGYMIYRFIVEDNGIGISEDFLPHVFEPFEREKNTTLSGVYGTGLGLAITKRLVEVIGGSVEVSSTVGAGSKFMVTIPLYVRQESTYIPEESEVLMRFANPKRVLIVDDNEINLEIENEVLKDAGFLVDTADDGSIAVEKIKHSKPGDYDLILMDIQMPIMDGYHAARAIRSMEDSALAGIPIIAVSANSFEKDKKMAIESGMNAHLPKPLDTHHLYRVIRQLLKDDNRTIRPNEVRIRSIKKNEYPLLRDFLYDAVYLPEKQPLPPRDIIEKPDLAVYIKDFGQPDDLCLLAEVNGQILGAVWTRILAGEVKGYGNIARDVPEIAISVKKAYRKQGIGTKMMEEMIELLKRQGYDRVSLSVNKENYAYHMYQKLGFQVIKVQEEDYLMVLELI